MRNVGQFETEEILIALKQTPVLFTAAYEDYRYLFLAHDYGKSEYIFIKVTNDDLILLLKGKMTLLDIFKKQRAIYLTYINENDNRLKCRGYNNNEFPKEFFPPNEYYRVNFPYIYDYISILEEEDEEYYYYE